MLAPIRRHGLAESNDSEREGLLGGEWEAKDGNDVQGDAGARMRWR